MGKYREPKETDIQIQILRYLKAIGAYGGKTKTVGIKRGRAFCIDPYLFRGFADLTCFYNKQLYFIEVKRPDGKLSELQKHRIKQLENEQFKVFVLYE